MNFLILYLCLSLIVSFTLHRGKGSLTLKESAIYSAEWVTAVLHLLTPPATDYNTAASDNHEHLSLWPLSTPSPPSLSSLLPQSHGGTESHERRYSAMCLPGFFFFYMADHSGKKELKVPNSSCAAKVTLNTLFYSLVIIMECSVCLSSFLEFKVDIKRSSNLQTSCWIIVFKIKHFFRLLLALLFQLHYYI